MAALSYISAVSGINQLIINTSFTENVVKNNSKGAAIYTGSDLTVNSSEFTSNRASHGTIFNYSANLKVNNSIFTGNDINTAGGAIMSTGENASHTINSSKFINNTARNDCRRCTL